MPVKSGGWSRPTSGRGVTPGGQRVFSALGAATDISPQEQKDGGHLCAAGTERSQEG